ncbi:hypothetical protein PBCVAP110A_020R [Paramecium bursaria Chlorella virus AP110A]|nr:hypothetical protein PBCVAP110A_020R [Paramecium bursaria Chlorella virus AP110A]
MSDYLMKTLEYYFEDDSHVIFKKYTCDTLGIIKNKKSGKTPSYGNGTYNSCGVYDDDGKRRNIFVYRAVASTFLGKPPTLNHTADHIESEQKKNDALTNIRWATPLQQRANQIRPEMYKAAFIIVKDGIEKTVNEWVKHMNAEKTPEEREFTTGMISMYAQRKTNGFAYKEYPDIKGEKWKEVEGSDNKKGRWKISNMNRVKRITNAGTENVLSGERLGHDINGYPTVGINGKKWLCHILAFAAFHTKMWNDKQSDEMVLHKDDDKEDFRPHKLRLGTASDNGKDSHINGKYDGMKSSMMKCASYLNGVHEEDHDSQSNAAKYIISKECSEASVESIVGGISMALSGNYKNKTAYGRTWKII